MAAGTSTASRAATIGFRSHWRRRSAADCASARNSWRSHTAARSSARASSTPAPSRRSPATTWCSPSPRPRFDGCRSRPRCRRNSTRRSPVCDTDARRRRCCSSRGRFWRTPGRARAFGSALPFGAVWDGNEQQRGRAGILSLLAGGSASDASQAIARPRRRAQPSWTRSTGSAPAAPTLSRHGRSCGSRIRSSRGGYAYFDPGFDPSLRPWLAHPVRPPVLRRRAHQHPVAGLHERRHRERPSRRSRGCGRSRTHWSLVVGR